MSKLVKKIISIATTTTVAAMMMVPAVPAGALTAEELQQQIADLQAQLAALQAQLSSLGGGGTSGTVPAACVGISFSRNLAVGSTGSDVKCLQAVLNTDPETLVASSGVGSAGYETQYFGPLTKGAVIKFQNNYASEVLASWGLTQGTGFVGSTTRAKLNSILSAGTGDGGDGGTTPPPPPGAGLTISLASDNPVAATIVADSISADGAQAMIPMLKIQLANGDSSDVKVTELKLKRGGISADADVSQAYLYEGSTKIIDYQSFTESVLTFANSAGLITIPAGGTKVLTLKVDLTNGTGSGKTMSFSLEAATDLTSDASQVSGTYPLSGNLMSTATTADLGKLDVATSTSPAASVDPQDGFDVFNFTLAGSDQKLEVRRIKVHNTGSTDADDLQNLKLYDGATQIGSTIAQMNDDKTVIFDLSGDPLVINKGITKVMHVKADLTGGTNRTFKFSIRELTDIEVFDTQYSVYLKPDMADTFTIHEMSNTSTISTGRLTLSRALDSPSGNIPKDGTNITLAKFDVKAEGEDVKMSDMSIEGYGTVLTGGLYQLKIVYDGAQKGTTDSAYTTAADSATATTTTFTFGNTFVVAADGETHTIEIRADAKRSDGTSYSGSETITMRIDSATAIGRTSAASVTVSSATGFQLTISSGAVSAAINQAYSDWSASNPTAVPGATQVLVGSFIISAGASEGVDITGIETRWATTTNNCVQKMNLYKGTKETGTHIGSELSNVSASATSTFYPSPYISLAASEQFTLNVYADVLNQTATPGQCEKVVLGTISGTGKTTNTPANSSGSVYGQANYIASAGRMDVNVDAANPVADMVVMGTSGVTLAKLRYSASSSAEDINVTYLVATTTLGGSAPTSTLKNITVEGDGLSASKAALDIDGNATFDLTASPWVIPAGTEKVLTVKANVNTYVYASSGSSVAVGIATTTYKGAMSGTENHEIAKGAESAGNSHLVYKTRPTVAADEKNSTLSSGNKILLEFTVSADAGGAVRLYSVNLNTSLLDIATTSSDLAIQDLTLYDKNVPGTALNDYVASATGTATTYNTTSTVASFDFGTNNDLNSKTGNIKLYNNAGTYLDEVPAGGSVTYQVQAYVTGVGTSGDNVTLSLDNLSTATDDNTNAIIWGDGLDVGISANKIKAIPSNSWSFSVQ